MPALIKFCVKCNKEIPFKKEIDGKIIKRTYKRTQCYDCYPYQKGAKTSNRHKYKGQYHCIKCNTTKNKEEFYLDDEGYRTYHYCRSCQKSYIMNRQQSFKEQCVEYKGGKCEKCGYNRCLAALEFHHKDPTQKDFAITKSNTIIMTPTVKEEIDKCLLLCSNCHREEHNNLNI